MKELIRFKNNNQEYVLLNDNNNLIYAKYDKGNILTNIKKEEKYLIKQVFVNLLPSKKIIKLSDLKYKNKDIKHLYDIEKDFHLFYEENFKFSNDTLNLNYIFNNQNEYYASNDFSKKEIKRIVNIGKKSLIITISFGMLLSLNITNLNMENAIASTKEVITEINDNRSSEVIINTILNNKNLSIEEKELFLSNTKYIIDNLDNFDYSTVLDNLNNLHIEYIDNLCPEDVNINGYYYHTGEEKYKIKIFNVSCFKNCDKSVLTHEFLHTFTKHGTFYKYYEAINTIINNEYFGNNLETYDNSYKQIQKYIYILAEIVGSDILMKCHANNNIITLREELTKIIPNPNLVYDLLFKIDEMLLGTDFLEMDKLDKEITNILIDYYEIKYKTSFKENINMYMLIDKKEASRLIGKSLGYKGMELDSISDNTEIKINKKIFNVDNDNKLVLSIPNEFEEKEYYVSLEEILSGHTNYNFKSKEEITLPKLEDGSYVGTYLYPVSYIDYEVPNINYKKGK